MCQFSKITPFFCISDTAIKKLIPTFSSCTTNQVLFLIVCGGWLCPLLFFSKVQLLLALHQPFYSVLRILALDQGRHNSQDAREADDPHGA